MVKILQICDLQIKFQALILGQQKGSGYRHKNKNTIAWWVLSPPLLSPLLVPFGSFGHLSLHLLFFFCILLFTPHVSSSPPPTLSNLYIFILTFRLPYSTVRLRVYKNFEITIWKRNRLNIRNNKTWNHITKAINVIESWVLSVHSANILERKWESTQWHTVMCR